MPLNREIWEVVQRLVEAGVPIREEDLQYEGPRSRQNVAILAYLVVITDNNILIDLLFLRR